MDLLLGDCLAEAVLSAKAVGCWSHGLVRLVAVGLFGFVARQPEWLFAVVFVLVARQPGWLFAVVFVLVARQLKLCS